MGTIYIIQDGSYVKIGKTLGDGTDRLKACQTGNPRKLSIAATFDVSSLPHKLGDVELSIHDELDHCRCEGEWFHLPVSEAKKVVMDRINQLRSGENCFELKGKLTPGRIACVPVRKDLLKHVYGKSMEDLDKYVGEAMSMKHKVDVGEKFYVDYFELSEKKKVKAGNKSKYCRQC